MFVSRAKRRKARFAMASITGSLVSLAGMCAPQGGGYGYMAMAIGAFVAIVSQAIGSVE